MHPELIHDLKVLLNNLRQKLHKGHDAVAKWLSPKIHKFAWHFFTVQIVSDKFLESSRSKPVNRESILKSYINP